MTLFTQYDSAPTRRPARRSGMTLMELLVAVGVLAILILAVSLIMARAKQVVVTSEAIMRNNAQGAALSAALRNEFRSISQFGFLCIMQDPNTLRNPADPNSYRPVLMYTVGEPSYSLTGTVDTNGKLRQSLARLEGVGMCYVYDASGAQAQYKNANGNLVPLEAMWHMGYLLDPTWDPNASAAQNVERPPWFPAYFSQSTTPCDFGGIQAVTAGMLANNLAVPGVSCYACAMDPSKAPVFGMSTAPGIRLPLNNISQVMENWKVASTHCSNFGLQWTDSSGNWYGVDSNGNVTAACGLAWRTRGPGTADPNAGGIPCAESYLAAWPVTSKNAYCAMFSSKNLPLWPTAIKVRFTLTDTAGETPVSTDYEVICLVGGMQKGKRP